MPKKSYQIGPEAFTSKRAVRARAARIYKAYPHRFPISVESEDHQFILGLLFHHYEASQKIGSGINSFFVAPAPDHPTTTCFWIYRTDKSETDFGVGACLDSFYQVNRASLRDLVSDQISEYRSARLPLEMVSFVSDFSGKTFPVAEAVVDHDPPFDFVIQQFFRSRAENPSLELLTVPTDASSKPVWKNPDVATSFLIHHKQAPLRLVHSRENISEIKRLNNIWINQNRV